MKNIIIPPVFVLLSLMLIVLFYFIFPEYNKVPFPFNLAGIIIIFSGFILMGKCRDLFKKYNTTLEFKESSHLVTEGVFSKTRNPMYIGMFLLLLGIAICFRNLFSMIVPFGFLLIIQLIFIPKEENLMLRAFGPEYLDYKKKVGRWGLEKHISINKFCYYLLLGLIVILSFRFFSSLYYPALNSDNAVTVLMIRYFKLPHDIYYWGIDRLGSLIPLIGHIFYKILNFSPLTCESITRYMILLFGYLAFSSFIKSYFYKIIFALIWFFPPMRLIDITQFYHGIHYSLIAIACYLINTCNKKFIKENHVYTHLNYILIILVLFAAVWVSDMAVISVFLLLSILLFFYIRNNGLRFSIMKEHFLYYVIVGIILGYSLIKYAKGLSPVRHNYSEWSSIPYIYSSIKIFLKTIGDFFLFKSNEPFTNVYAYLVILIFGLIITLYHKIKPDDTSRKMVILFLLDAVILFSVIMVSKWTYINNVPRRYFTCTYIALSFVMVILFDNLQVKNKVNNTIKVFILLTVLIGGIGTIYNLKYVWPKRLTPSVQIAGEFQKLGKIGVISEYWNSYIVSCTNPDLTIATPHDQAEVKNYDFVEEIFKQDHIYVNRDMWMKSFPDTLQQFGRILVKDGYPFRIGHSNVCKYRLTR